MKEMSQKDEEIANLKKKMAKMEVYIKEVDNFKNLPFIRFLIFLIKIINSSSNIASRIVE